MKIEKKKKKSHIIPDKLLHLTQTRIDRFNLNAIVWQSARVKRVFLVICMYVYFVCVFLQFVFKLKATAAAAVAHEVHNEKASA